MRLIKLPAMHLEPGMFVAELDRPWLETPFAVQGFVVQDADEVLYVSNYVDHVYVDAEYTGQEQSLRLAVAAMESKKSNKLTLKEEFARTKVSFESAAETLDRVFDSLRIGNSEDIDTIQAAINPLIEGVFRNQDAVAALLRLKESGEYRYQHSVSMAIWSTILGRHIGLQRRELEKLAVGCAMCDIGMTQLPRELLDQAENLSEKQMRIVKAHPTMGSDLASNSDNADFEILGIIENHHERMDGSGYPRGIEGASIPLLARIAGLVDTYDAMITPRPYAKARTSHEATQELLDAKDTLFQGSLVEQFVQAIGLFPTGTMVELSSGEVAIVVTQNSTRRLKPEVLIVLNPDKAPMEAPRALNLANQPIAAEGERWITRELMPGTYGINSEEFFI
ncbi:MAG: HD-GYP domain-containing protein [Halioglobus sp.]|nr:HD-GYP domain-containing protein [Halioglobus sp.]